MFGHTSDQHVPQSRPTMSGDDNQVDLLGRREIANRFGRLTGANFGLEIDAFEVESIDELPHLSLAAARTSSTAAKLVRAARIGGDEDWPGEAMEQHQAGVEAPREIQAVAQGGARRFRKVSGNQNRSKAEFLFFRNNFALPRAHDQNGRSGVLHHALCIAPQSKTLESAPTVRGHDNETGLKLAGTAADLVVGAADSTMKDRSDWLTDIGDNLLFEGLALLRYLT